LIFIMSSQRSLQRKAVAAALQIAQTGADMDLLKWIKSLDDLLFELMSWLVFWPLTLLRTLIGPLKMMRYADAQLALPEEEQYSEALSPPVFLVATLLVSHLVSVALGQPDEIIESRKGLGALVSDDTTALAVRLALFSAFPLIFSVLLLLVRQRKIDRISLRLPFYAQCYPAAVFAAAMAVAAEIALLGIGPSGASGLATIAAMLWLTVVEARWMRAEQGLGWISACALALCGVLLAGTLVVTVTLVFV
jgi:hypothetical protein